LAKLNLQLVTQIYAKPFIKAPLPEVAVRKTFFSYRRVRPWTSPSKQLRFLVLHQLSVHDRLWISGDGGGLPQFTTSL